MRNNTGTIALKLEKASIILLLVAVACIAPFFKQQLVTGTIVNAAIITGTLLLGVRSGLLICLLPGSIGLATGLLSPVLAPMVPFIIIGNAILALSVAYFNRLNYWAGLVLGGLVKFVFLWATGTALISLLANKQMAAAVTQMMTWPQLVTVVAGGCVAFGILKVTGKNRFSV